MNKPDIQLFGFNGVDVRTIQDEHGEPWFVLKDVCDVLEIKNPADQRKRLEPKDIDSIYTLTAGGKQKVIAVNESGLYDVVLDSRKPQAKAFRPRSMWRLSAKNL